MQTCFCGWKILTCKFHPRTLLPYFSKPSLFVSGYKAKGMQRKLANFHSMMNSTLQLPIYQICWRASPTMDPGPLLCGGYSMCRMTFNRLCMRRWSFLLSHVLHTCDQSGGTKKRFPRLKNDRWLAGALFPSFPSCHDISPSAHVETARFSKPNIALSNYFCVLFLRKVQYCILSEIYT